MRRSCSSAYIGTASMNHGTVLTSTLLLVYDLERHQKDVNFKTFFFDAFCLYSGQPESTAGSKCSIFL